MSSLAAGTIRVSREFGRALGVALFAKSQEARKKVGWRTRAPCAVACGVVVVSGRLDIVRRCCEQEKSHAMRGNQSHITRIIIDYGALIEPSCRPCTTPMRIWRIERSAHE